MQDKKQKVARQIPFCLAVERILAITICGDLFDETHRYAKCTGHGEMAQST